MYANLTVELVHVELWVSKLIIQLVYHPKIGIILRELYEL